MARALMNDVRSMGMRRWVVTAAIVMMAAASWFAAYRVASLTSSIAAELDRAGALTHIAPRPQATLVFDRHGRPAFSYFVEQRIDVPLTRVADGMIEALVAVEDQRFFSHYGIDPIRVIGAAWRNYQAGRIVQGGSTLTQQLARAAQLTRVRTFDRKIREILVAARLEERYSKQEILQEYLNTVYFGEGYYGVEAASRGYFGKSAADLNLAEAALLAALVRAPSLDAPCVSAERARGRRNLVLRLMREQERISDAEYRAAINAPLPDRAHQAQSLASTPRGNGLYFQEELRRQLVAQFGAERVLRGGLRVYSTYDPDLQHQAERVISTRIAQLAKSRSRARDLQGSLVAMDPVSGDVHALVGGRDFRESSFNRATQARRQAGSAFKPIIYAAALERGYAPGTMLRDLDTPIYASGKVWLPNGEHERSEYTLRRALKVSSNRAAAQLLQQVGVSTAVYYAHRMGIASDLPMVPSLALGTGEVTLLELTAAYSAFANNGYVATPRLMTRVEDQDGKTLWWAPESRVQAISSTTAYLMSSMLSDVVTAGTAANARSLGFKLPAAGKTGTTDDYADAWFIGYTPHLLTGVWFGLDTPAPIMNRGFAGTVAVPAWASFMRAATQGAKAEWYPMPADVEKVAICPISGARASDACRHALTMPAIYEGPVMMDATYPPAQPVAPRPVASVYEDLFPIGAVPSEECPTHSGVMTLDGYSDTGSPVATPMVDAALQQASATTATPIVNAPAIRSASPRLYVDRVRQADGSVKIVIRQR
jgi:penicillin-binding protein 1A